MDTGMEFSPVSILERLVGSIEVLINRCERARPPKDMKVAIYIDNHNIRIEDRPIPAPAPGDILVRTKACGVCVADTMEWYLKPKAPLSLGHEPTGVVAKVGEGVTTFKEGDRVAVH